MNNYYVYIYWRLDINEPFYVGKGHGNRWRKVNDSDRNKHFMNISNKHFVACEIVKTDLTEQQALDIECWIIDKLVFEYGYSIDILNNRSKERGRHLVNKTWGGDGVSCGHLSKETKRKISDALKGEKHPWYGKNHSDESKKRISNSHKGKKHSEETKRKMKKSQKGKFRGKNGNSKYIICLNDFRIFPSLLDASEFYNISHYAISKVLRGMNDNCGKKIGKKLKFRYLIWKHNKKYRIKKEND